ncbi:MAG TPA: T9SS type A sorting domain-containing protein [Saprospiraceae bacterium]|nr:T9SS type A sorting domain-containing protein [Saprospiraceae bacterium]
MFPNFDQHVALYDVDDVSFTGCEFINASSSESNQKQYQFGYGIAAIDAGFVVSAATVTPQDPEPCLPGTCEVLQSSRFQGLGYGIWTGSFSENKLFRVYQADFEDCYTGIEVDGVSDGVMILNNFDMGTVPDPDVMDGDQVGIKLNQQLAGFTIEENMFTESSGNTNHTIGIAAENLGDMNSVIRKNRFSGLTLANEAFGQNGSTGLVKDGLRYTCNVNSSTTDKDFFVKDSDYGTDNMSALQVDFASDGSQVATGNAFSSTGDQDDGDFANYGVDIDEYHYYQSSSVQVPDDVEGIVSIIPGPINSCAQAFCSPPCLSSNDLTDLRDEYFDQLENYEGFVSEEEWGKAASTKFLMDHASLLMIQHYLIDSTSFHRDSLRAWYARVLTVSGDILLAKDYAAEEDYSTARQVLEDISSRFDLSAEVEDDIAVIDTIFGMLDARGIGGLTQGDVDDLIDFSDSKGHASSIARSLLMLRDYRFSTNYVLPDPTPEPFILLPENGIMTFEEVTVYPNPNNGDEINIFLPAPNDQEIHIKLWSIHDELLINQVLSGSESSNVLRLEVPGGIYVYSLYRDDQIVKMGRLIIHP